MAEFSVRLEGVDEVRTRLALFPQRLRRNILRGAIRAAAVVMRKGVQARVPVRTVALRRSVTVSTRAYADGRVEGKVTVGGRKAFYANIVEVGAKQHVIRAATAGALNLGNGRIVEEVRHPGFRGRGFVAATQAAEAAPASRAFFEYAQVRINADLEGK